MARRLLGAALAVAMAAGAGACSNSSDDEGRVLGAGAPQRTVDPTTTTTAAETLPTTTTSPSTTTTVAAAVSGDGGSTTTTSAAAQPSSTTTTSATAESTTTTTVKPVAYPADAKEPDARVKLTLALDRTEVDHGQTVIGTLTVENTSDEEVRFDHGDGCTEEWGLYRNGKLMGGREPAACTQAVVPDRLRPHEKREYRLTFDTLDTEAQRKSLPAGDYDAFGGADTIDGTWYAPPLVLRIR